MYLEVLDDVIDRSISGNNLSREFRLSGFFSENADKALTNIYISYSFEIEHL